MSDRIQSVSSEATGEVTITTATATMTLSREAVQELSDYLLGVLDQRDKDHEHDWQPYGVGERCTVCLKVRQESESDRS